MHRCQERARGVHGWPRVGLYLDHKGSKDPLITYMLGEDKGMGKVLMGLFLPGGGGTGRNTAQDLDFPAAAWDPLRWGQCEGVGGGWPRTL